MSLHNVLDTVLNRKLQEAEETEKEVKAKEAEDEVEDKEDKKVEESEKEEAADKEENEEETVSESEQLRSVAAALIQEAVSEKSTFSVADTAIRSLCESEEFTQETTDAFVSMFESAVSEVTKNQLESIVETATNAAVVIAEQFEIRLEDRMSEYLDVVVESWKEENKPVLEDQAQARIAQSFLEGVKNLFETHNVVVKDEEVSILESAMAAGEEVVSELAEKEQELQEAFERIRSMEKSMAMGIVSEKRGLTESQRSRAEKIAENIEYADTETFVKAFDMVCESVSGRKITSKRSMNESVVDLGDSVEVQLEEPVDAVAQYAPEVQSVLNALSKHS